MKSKIALSSLLIISALATPPVSSAQDYNADREVVKGFITLSNITHDRLAPRGCVYPNNPSVDPSMKLSYSRDYNAVHDYWVNNQANFYRIADDKGNPFRGLAQHISSNNLALNYKAPEWAADIPPHMVGSLEWPCKHYTRLAKDYNLVTETSTFETSIPKVNNNTVINIQFQGIIDTLMGFIRKFMPNFQLKLTPFL